MEVTQEELNAASWRKASLSGPDGGDCIEVAPLRTGRFIGIRDTEAPEKSPYIVRSAVFAAFVDGAKKGEFDF